MAFILGSPRVLSSRVAEDEPVVHLAFDSTHKCRDRVVLAHHVRKDVGVQDGNIRVAWNRGSSELAVLTGGGALLFYSMIKAPAAFSLPSLLADAGVDAIRLQLRRRCAPGFFLSCIATDFHGIVCGTSDGGLLRVSW
ncbi:hypothetical protein T484DRAFT_1849698 [Baffinella frigidus]|nr:hypothetical protein T484DRAFT_1849698 [Cryptophyta sp. CCMP2293]